MKFDLLVWILAKVETGDVTGNDDKGRRIEGGIGYSRDRIGHSRPDVGKHNPRFMGDPEVGVCGVCGYLFMTESDEFYPGLERQRVQ
jgi:hypothetical protein